MFYEPKPVEAFDRFMYEEEQRYEKLLETATCGECQHCQTPDSGWTGKGPMFDDPDVGYCHEGECFTHLSDMPRDIECENFTPY